MHNQHSPYQDQPTGGNPYPTREQRRPASQNSRGTGNEPPRRKDDKKKQPKSHWFRALLMVLATVVGCLFLAVFVLQSASDLFGLNQESEVFKITVPEGADIKLVTDILYEKGIIDKKITFNVYAGRKTKETGIKAGDYDFNSDMSYDQIISMLKTGDITNRTVTIRFLEGSTVEEIALELEENDVCKADDFLTYIQTEDFLNYDFYNDIPKDRENRYFKLEGYIFPDTYEFYVDEKISSVVDKFLTNFQNHISSDMKSRMNTIKMDLDDVITLASIIQKEAGEPTEMRRVSSVFHNRLDNSANFPRLQSDVTLFYVEDFIKNRTRSYTIASTQDVYDAYNTYVGEGLPAGPICNPGEEAIMAALYPASTNYYYFVTDVEGDYYYAATLSDHNINIAEAESQDKSGKGVVHGISTQDSQDAQK